MIILKQIFFLIVCIGGLSVFAFSAFLLFATIADFKPAEREVLELHNPTHFDIVDKQNINLMIWNIGYAGLGREMDFFYDGGKGVRPPKEMNVKYIKAIESRLSQNDSMDFILLQEVDLDARRSYRKNQFAFLGTCLDKHSGVCAINYNVKFVPVPFTNPMGRVVSGLANYSRFDPISSVRHSFPGNFGWPKKLFMLDRCFILQRYRTINNFDLVLINTHNSAFDDGSLRTAQMLMLKDIALDEYEKGNVVIIGGDWNLTPPGYDPDKQMSGYLPDQNITPEVATNNILPQWKWVFDPSLPTNRRVDKPFIKETSYTSIIDYFLVSPNVQIKSVETLDWGFDVSDHNPVIISLEMF